ncbi:hypothetical protein F5148DRAFT_1252153 [Russula earlei]|uniref:Uncharacterized protein n=1 Tax=Russula earlei TaxID=71964 RepID=A0ACC0TTL7_9AGAM|nr:hypothetical protein F5148DRAFT_1252153 [Russula earlei]
MFLPSTMSATRSKRTSSKILRKAQKFIPKVFLQNTQPHSQKIVLLELHVPTSLVRLYPQPPEFINTDSLADLAMTAGPPNSSDSTTCLLHGLLEDFLIYSRREKSQWLIDIAHDICDPLQKRGSLQVLDASGEGWINVNPTDPLIGSTYLYEIEAMISLSKISVRTGRSITSATSNATTMANQVRERDGKCWVTESEDPLTNSHMCPKRMGDHVLRIIYRDFVSTIPPPAPLSIYDDICGITLTPTLDHWFDTYELGLHRVGPDLYECHSFLPPGWPEGLQRTIVGAWRTPPSAFSLLHGHRARPPQPQHPRNPPPGLIRWHYLQCVLRKPMRMEGDSDDEGNDSNFDWPSADLDRGRAMQGAVEQQNDLQRSVAEWIIAAK